MKAEQKRLYDVLETMPVMVCLLTPDYHVSFANRSFREKFGEANGRHCYEYCFGRSEPCDFCETYNVLKTGKPHHWEITSPDGRSIIDAYDFPFTDTDGSPLILEMDIDITGRKKLDKKLYDYQQQLKALTSQLSLIEERSKRKIAAELHDNVGQKLAVAKLELQSLMRSTPDTKMSDSINSICGEITHIMDDVSSLTFELGNPLLDEIGLTVALEKYITEEIQAKFGIKCELNDEAGAQDLEETVRTVLYRSTRELLINSVKHAQAHNIKVRIYQSAGNIHICVEDDGVGFEVGEIASLPTKTGGFGLFSIKEQLEYIGGNLQIESRVGHGTKVTISCPPKLKQPAQI